MFILFWLKNVAKILVHVLKCLFFNYKKYIFAEKKEINYSINRFF